MSLGFIVGFVAGAAVTMLVDRVLEFIAWHNIQGHVVRAAEARASSSLPVRTITDVDGHEVPVTALDVRTLAAMETYLDALDAQQSRGIKH